MERYLLFYFSFMFAWGLCQPAPETVFQCDFERGTCGFVNDIDHEARWERRIMNLGGRSSIMMVVKAEAKKNQMARLLSPILDQHWNAAEGCLTFDLFTAGDGVTAFRVKRQDGSGVLPLIGIHTQVSKWRTYNLHVDIDDYIRFVFDAHVNSNLGGTVVAIDNVSFSLEDCKS